VGPATDSSSRDGEAGGTWKTGHEEMTVMHQLTLLGYDHHRQRLADADQQRSAERLLALARATRRAGRAGRRVRRAERQARRLRAQVDA
jgi:hypothetical protein